MSLRLARPFVPLALIVAAGCVPRAAPPPEAPAPVPAPAPIATPQAIDWQDWPVTPGRWRYARDGGGSHASFGTAQGAPVAALRCAAGAVRLSRTDGAAGPITIRTNTATRTLPVASDGTATLAARDPLLDAIVFSRGRFTIERAGSPALVLPPWSEVARVVEDCRG